MNDAPDILEVRRGGTGAPGSGEGEVRPEVKAERLQRPALVRRAPVEDEKEDGFFAKHKIKIIIGVILLAGGGYMASQMGGGKAPPKAPAKERMFSIALPPPPPPPPPPP
ncbi:MAG TPA: hypothetical protein VLE43_19130, partial [Candidatus Saccharimonadia bacterium]|nr:hypothetical protein [Candidatus Saccharimonadia bacterium]